MSKTISLGKTPRIKVDSIGGDLSIVGWDGDGLVKGDEDSRRPARPSLNRLASS